MLIVTGCQRSGTLTMSKILGIPHEKQFIPEENPLDIPSVVSEVSWMAAPFLKDIPTANVLHIVRHPMKVINSILGIGIFNLNSPEKELHDPYREFIYKHIPIDQNATDIGQALQYWLLWNELIEPYATARILIENIYTKIVLNQRPRKFLNWNDFPSSLRDQVRQKAYEYGYHGI